MTQLIKTDPTSKTNSNSKKWIQILKTDPGIEDIKFVDQVWKTDRFEKRTNLKNGLFWNVPLKPLLANFREIPETVLLENSKIMSTHSVFLKTGSWARPFNWKTHPILNWEFWGVKQAVLMEN